MMRRKRKKCVGFSRTLYHAFFFFDVDTGEDFSSRICFVFGVDFRRSSSLALLLLIDDSLVVNDGRSSVLRDLNGSLLFRR